jgi:hypothetical protein
MVCQVCVAIGPHEGKPEGCKGGTWCDCQHRLPIVIQKMNEESTTSSKLIETGETKNV